MTASNRPVGTNRAPHPAARGKRANLMQDVEAASLAAGASADLRRLLDKVQLHLHLSENAMGACFAIWGATAGTMIGGDLPWLMVIGPPGSGKTELQRSILHVKGIEPLFDITGPGAFLSGTNTKERAADASGGLLRKIGAHGLIMIDDFTGILEMKEDNQGMVMNVFRQAYSGRYERSVGAEGARTLRWAGRLGFIAGCTPIIDSRQEVYAAMGERWMNYWMEEQESSRDAVQHLITKRALENAGKLPVDKKDWRHDLRDAVAFHFEMCDLGFNAAGPMRHRPSLSPEHEYQIARWARFASKGRSVVLRDKWTGDICSPPEVEGPSRIATALAQMKCGMEAIGVGEAAQWKVLGKIALDSMPKLRRLVLGYVFDYMEHATEPVSMSRLTDLLRVSAKTARYAVEDLEVHGMVRREASGVGNGKWVLMTEFAREEMRRFKQL